MRYKQEIEHAKIKLHFSNIYAFGNLVEVCTSRPGAISTKTPYGAIDLISQFLKHRRKNNTYIEV